MSFDELSAILPIDAFAVSLEIPYSEKGKTKELPDLTVFSAEERFADVSAAWSEEGLFFQVKVNKAFEEAYWPRFQQGDAFELFIDTRDIKTAGFLTKFCHHFVFLPQAVDEIQAQEITHFRTEDKHELCNPSDLKVEAQVSRRSYALKIFIPSQCLHGYDPTSFKRLGFTYVVHRFGDDPQHFSLSSEYMTIEQNPSLWATIKMEE